MHKWQKLKIIIFDRKWLKSDLNTARNKPTKSQATAAKKIDEGIYLIFLIFSNNNNTLWDPYGDHKVFLTCFVPCRYSNAIF